MSRGTNGPSSKGSADAASDAPSDASSDASSGGAGEPGRNGQNIVLGITGGIAAYKGAELCRLLIKAGATVRVVLTDAATHFVTPLTLQTLSGHRVARDLFDLDEESEIGHIRLADQADLIVVAPATADFIARLAAGLASDLLSAVVLASRAPVLLAPAMNVNMWHNPITQANLGRLLGAAGGGRFSTVGPDRGELACGWVGQGRLIEPLDILTAAQAFISSGEGRVRTQAIADADADADGDADGERQRVGDLSGRQVVVTAGPTREPIDDVRFLGNRSSGKMGFAVAQAAAARGARVTLIAGPVALATPPGVAARVDVETAAEMAEALAAATPSADVVVMAAAVADFRPAARIAGKLSRHDAPGSGGALPALALVANPDLLAQLGRGRHGTLPVLVGFAAEAGGGPAMLARARQKLAGKQCDIVVANDVSAPGTGFGAEDNHVILVFADGRAVELPRAPKLAIAGQIWDHVVDTLAGRARSPQTVAEATPSAVPPRSS
ncbi:MAG TPA: bifunctional phosphopantothenoylcysteine decarboxylase/phosphopantothenate synthase [Polyangia bacterium]|jgi:phosphopantothenoylcysteine decarboxylase/phosphopantothenate--cysteine ligase|nr:bifunctional phosphopantothenoylcysteine decarboxylase/phosphopantothenate synthase [Polyangia bacterium]